jgi:hypothetical protein
MIALSIRLQSRFAQDWRPGTFPAVPTGLVFDLP